jgi:hypothetical protein
MSEENKGKVKITVEIEVNEALMDTMKGCIKKMPEMVKTIKGD